MTQSFGADSIAPPRSSAGDLSDCALGHFLLGGLRSPFNPFSDAFLPENKNRNRDRIEATPLIEP
jgi:hypothetical protein